MKGKMENKKDNCLCGAGDYIVMACSGASDFGHISDLVARKLSNNGVREINCLAVVGAGIEKSIENFSSFVERSATNVLNVGWEVTTAAVRLQSALEY
jgi:uncharacterized metal-binding protein